MSEQSFEELLNAEETVRIHNGAVISGKVIDVKENEIILDIGYKTEGVITKAEYSNDPDVDLQSAVSVGDVMDVKVIRSKDNDGSVALSYKRLSQDRVSKALEEPFENQAVIKGKVTQVVKGGLSVDYEGASVFIPASLVSDRFERNLDKYQGQEIEFVLIEFNPRKRRIVGDRKQVVEAQKKAALEELLGRISVGMVVTGKIKNFTDFGAFIDLGGADGLLHVSEMSWGRIDNPKKLFRIGDEVEAYIKEIKENKIALSIRFPENDPWTEDSPSSVGNTVTGKVARMIDFGAFVELEPGIDGLLHVSQISHERIEKPSDVLSVGQEITAKVIAFNPEEHKISLSMKALLPAPEASEETEAPVEEATEAPAEETAEAPAEEAAEAPAEEAAEAPAEEAAEATAEEAAEAPTEEAAEEAPEEPIAEEKED